jgi:uncharacterized membrane protein YphA (DoxX/SURF4 family)
MHISLFHIPPHYIAFIIKYIQTQNMEKVLSHMRLVEMKLVEWAEVNSFRLLRLSIGIIYIMYGVLKFFPNHSPAEQLAVDTIQKLSMNLFSGSPALLSLALIETLIGLCLIFHYRLKWIIGLAVGHMLGTFLPLFFFPEQAFTTTPISFSLVGQYIIKNLVIVSALFVLYLRTMKKQS